MQSHFNLLQMEKYTVVDFTVSSLMDMLELQRLGEALVKLVDEQDRRHLVLNFEKVQYVSSQAVGIILTLHRKIGQLKGRLVLSGVGPRLMELLRITHLDKLLEVRPAGQRIVPTR